MQQESDRTRVVCSWSAVYHDRERGARFTSAVPATILIPEVSPMLRPSFVPSSRGRLPRLSLRALGLAALLLLVGACSTQRSSSRRVQGDPDVMTIEEISGATAHTVFDLIQARHPLWLRKRGQNSINNDGQILVYQDNVRLGGVDLLRQINPQTVRMIQYFDATRAQQRYGIGHDHGVILVMTQAGAR